MPGVRFVCTSRVICPAGVSAEVGRGHAVAKHARLNIVGIWGNVSSPFLDRCAALSSRYGERLCRLSPLQGSEIIVGAGSQGGARSSLCPGLLAFAPSGHPV